MPIQPEDILLRLVVTQEEAEKGGKRPITFTTLYSCESCNGSGSYGEFAAQPCSKCGATGIRKKRILSVKHCRKCRGIGFVTDTPCAKCGGRGQVQADRTIDITIPEQAQNGQTLRITGNGNARDWRLQGSGNPGDVLVKLTVLQQGEKPAFAELGDMFDSIFGGQSGGGDGGEFVAPQKMVSLELTPEEHRNGCSKELSYVCQHQCRACDGDGGEQGEEASCQNYGRSRQGQFLACPFCGGTGATPETKRANITIPAGANELTLEGQGDYDKKTGSYGALVVKIHIK